MTNKGLLTLAFMDGTQTSVKLEELSEETVKALYADLERIVRRLEEANERARKILETLG